MGHEGPSMKLIDMPKKIREIFQALSIPTDPNEFRH